MKSPRMTLSHTFKALITMAWLSCSASAFSGLINSGFENPNVETPTNHLMAAPDSVPGWQSTDSAIEIWANGFGGVTSFEGDQHAEINAYVNGTLFQDVSGIAAGSQVGFEFAHRGRHGIDTMALTITDLGIDGLVGGGDDTVLFEKGYATNNTAWAFYSSLAENPIFALGNTVRVAYSAISTAKNISAGNFLDVADFGTDVGVPVPSSLALIGLGLAGIGYRLRGGKQLA